MRSERCLAGAPDSDPATRHFQQGAAVRGPRRYIRPNAARGLPRGLVDALLRRGEGGRRQLIASAAMRAQAVFRRLNLMEAFSWPRPFPGDILPQRDDLFRPADQEQVVEQAGGLPGAGRLSVRRPRGELDPGLAHARIRAAGDLPETGETGGQVEQIVVGMADCRIGRRAGAGAGHICAGFLHRAGGVRSGRRRSAACCISCCRIRRSIRRAAARTRTCSPIPAFRCCSSRCAGRAHRSGA